MAPRAGAQPPAADQAHGLPRDHPWRDRRRRRQPARDQRRPGPRAGDPAHPRPALRLRGLAGPVEEGHAAVVRRPRAVGGDPGDRRARAGPHAVPLRRLLGHHRDVRRRHGGPVGRPGQPQHVRRRPGCPRRRPHRQRTRLRRGRPAHREGLGGAPSRRARRSRAGRTPRGCCLCGDLGRGQAVHPPSVRAVHDLDPAAGGRAQAAAVQPADDAHRPAAVRERLHHLYAYRLDDAVRDGAQRCPVAGEGAVRRPVRARCAPALREEGQERPGGARGDPPRR